MNLTSIVVELVAGRHRVRHREGLLRAQRVHGPDDRCRLALLATSGLLLGGDDVLLEVEVGAGAHLELSDVAGTVAYHGRGRPASWRTRLRCGPGARLDYRGEPFVVSDGASVTRSTEVEVAADATCRLRETLVLGRAGEAGGRLHTSTLVRRAGEDLLLESLALDPEERRTPGWLGPHRVVDSWLVLGGARPEIPRPAVTFALPGADAWLTRFLGGQVHRSPLARLGREGQSLGLTSSAEPE